MKREPYRTYGIVALELIVFWLLWFSPVYAETILFECADFNQGEDYTCDGPAIDFAVNGYLYKDNGGLLFTPDSTIYVSFMAEGTGAGTVRTKSGASNGDATAWGLGLNEDIPLTVINNTTWNSILIQANTFEGTVTDICVSTTEGECGETPPEPPGPTPLTASTTIIVNPTQDLFNGILLLFLSFALLIWVFKKV